MGNSHILGVILTHFALLTLITSNPSKSISKGNETLSSKSDTLQPLPFRLSRSVIPLSYRIQMVPILEAVSGYERFTAGGRVEIRARCDEVTREIKLHVKELSINESSIQVLDSIGEPLNFQVGYQPEYDFLVLSLENNLSPQNTYDITILYTAPISQERLDGMYLDSYVDPRTGETRYVATTLFAANHARRAFPCFDEPDMKAEFEIKIGRASDYHALSNMHLVDTQPMTEIQGWFLDTFAKTPAMSTYLICMIVSDLTYEEASNNTPNSTLHRIYAPYYFIDRGGGKYSANLSVTTLSAFESYYDLDYPLKKLDNVALPQFYFNAMENWGLMTYADRVLIYFQGETPEAQKYQLSVTVSHEVSHNFFGNIVTCKWWTFVWLNEGWATFASHLGLYLTYPDLRPWDQFIPNVYQDALNSDDSLQTHPVANEPLTVNDIGSIYDDIAYKKGASLIRMMENFLTENILQIGVQRYLKQWVYNSTQQDDLFEKLQQVVDEVNPNVLPTGITIKEIMDTWTKQVGFPIIKVSRINSVEIMISQEQFVSNGIPTGNESWWIPINIQILTGSFPGIRTIWMAKDQRNITFVIPESDLFLLNPGSTGYYRVAYSDTLFKEVVQIMTSKVYFTLESSTRVKIIDDAFTLVFSDKLPLGSVIELIDQIEEDTDYFVWKTVRKHLEKLWIQVLGTGYEKSLTNFILSKLESVERKLLTKEMTPTSVMLQEELEGWKCQLNLELCKEQIKSLVTDHNMHNLYSDVQREFEIIINMIASPKMIKTSVIDAEISQLGKDAVLRQTALEILKNNLKSRTSISDRKSYTNLLTKLCGYSNSIKDVLEVKKFINANSEKIFADDLRKLEKCISDAQRSIDWMKSHENDLILFNREF